jgi:AraC-like DNA-binding protein
VADPAVVTLYTRGQRYARSVVSPEGDDCEWFAVRRDVLTEAVAAFDESVRDRPRGPFAHAYAPCPARAYLSQRVLFEAARSGRSPDSLAVEEAVMTLLAEVLRSAYGFWGGPRPPRRATPRRRDIVERAKVLLAARLAEPVLLSELARAVGVSAFHLCRTFKAVTGDTLHSYRNRLRLQHALERVTAGEDLARVGLAVGYSSHSHFTQAFRRVFGLTPSVARCRSKGHGTGVRY